MNVEERLVDALATLDRVEPAPDLFARVRRSVAEDRAHRRRVRRVVAGVVVGGASVVAVVAAATTTAATGVLEVRLTVLALVEAAVLLALVVVLGPVVRRFGSILAAAAFAVTPGADRAFLRLLDLAYYLVFVGYVLVAMPSADLVGQAPLAAALSGTLARTAGLLLLMGAMHAATIIALPLVGLLHTSTVRLHRRRAVGRGAPAPAPAAAQAERVVRVLSWIVLASVALVALFVVGAVIGTAG